MNRFFIAVPRWNGLYTITVLNAGSRSSSPKDYIRPLGEQASLCLEYTQARSQALQEPSNFPLRIIDQLRLR
uniref:hypothetical protein n=1 Tax=Burkholderia sp. BCC1998 TaxID=2817447 RepID=UPI002AB7B39E